MPFPKGVSGNPGGKRKPVGLSLAVRKSEGLKTWGMLLDIRDSKIREEKIEMEDGEPVVVDVVPSIRERRTACDMILNRCWGLPVHSGHDELERRIVELEKRLEERLKETPAWQTH